MPSEPIERFNNTTELYVEASLEISGSYLARLRSALMIM